MALLPLTYPITPHHVGDGQLGRHPDAGVHVVGAHAALHHLAPLPLKQRPDRRADLWPVLLVEDLPPVLGYPDYVVGAVPPGV